MGGQRFCEQCGANLAAPVRFCERCGAPVRGAGAAAAQPAPSAVPSQATVPPVAQTHIVQPPPAQAAHAAQPARGGMHPAWVAAALLALLGLACAGWLLRPPAPPAPGTGLDLTPSAYDDLPSRVSPAPPLPAEAPPLPDDPLAQARERRERAYERYTRVAIGEIDGDIDAARREYQQADAALKALESR